MFKQWSREADYKLIVTWFDSYDWSPIPKESLPNTSFITYNKDGIPIIFTSFYGADCDFSLLGYTISNPAIDVKSDEITEALEKTIVKAKELGYNYMHYSTGRGGIGIVKKLTSLGWTVTSSKAYILRISLNDDKIDFMEEE